MDFDHVRGEKIDTVNHLFRNGASKSAILAEMGKCDVICANCHRIRTNKKRKMEVAVS